VAQPQAARITCKLCDGWYESESDLRDHMQAAHRRFIPAPSAFQYGGTHPENIKSGPRLSKEEWTNLSVLLRDRVKARFNAEELESIDRFILLASQSSVFNSVCL